jgi:uncharacterized protein (TIGR03437 family)
VAGAGSTQLTLNIPLGTAPGTTAFTIRGMVPVAPVSLTIGGINAEIQYAGGAPGFRQGLLQVNAVVPAGLESGPQPLVLKIGENSNAQQRVTVAVQ